MNPWHGLKQLKIRSWIVLAAMVVGVILFSAFEYQLVGASQQSGNVPILTPGPTIAPPATGTPSSLGTGKGPIAGIAGSTDSYAGISWIRLSYPTCGWGNLAGDELKTTIQSYHQQGIRVLLILCQASSGGPKLLNTQVFNDVAHGGADAVQCGNEQMKYNPPATLYVAPQTFARFYDLCASAVHAVTPNVPVLLGSLDPHVGGVDFQPLADQVQYLNQVQSAMNTSVHPGGHWNWRQQASRADR